MNPQDNKNAPVSPTANGQPVQPHATPGTEQRQAVKVWLPRFIIAALLSNVLFGVAVNVFDATSMQTIETARNIVNAVLIVGFLVIILKQLTEKNS